MHHSHVFGAALALDNPSLFISLHLENVLLTFSHTDGKSTFNVAPKNLKYLFSELMSVYSIVHY